MGIMGVASRFDGRSGGARANPGAQGWALEAAPELGLLRALAGSLVGSSDGTGASGVTER